MEDDFLSNVHIVLLYGIRKYHKKHCNKEVEKNEYEKYEIPEPYM